DFLTTQAAVGRIADGTTRGRTQDGAQRAAAMRRDGTAEQGANAGANDQTHRAVMPPAIIAAVLATIDGVVIAERVRLIISRMIHAGIIVIVIIVAIGCAPGECSCRQGSSQYQATHRLSPLHRIDETQCATRGKSCASSSA